MKLSYSMALLFPPVLSNLETSNSRIEGDTAYPRLSNASLNSDESIFPLLSLSNLSKIPCITQEVPINFHRKGDLFSQAKRKTQRSAKLTVKDSLTYPPFLETVEH